MVANAIGKRNAMSSDSMFAISWPGIKTRATKTVAKNMAITIAVTRMISLKRLVSCRVALFIVIPLLGVFFLLIDHVLPKTTQIITCENSISA